MSSDLTGIHMLSNPFRQEFLGCPTVSLKNLVVDFIEHGIEGLYRLASQDIEDPIGIIPAILAVDREGHEFRRR